MIRLLHILVPVLFLLGGCASGDFRASQPTLYTPKCANGLITICESRGGIYRHDTRQCTCATGLTFW